MPPKQYCSLLFREKITLISMAFRSRWNSVQRTASMCWRHSIKVVESAVCRPCCISWPYRSWRNVHSGWWMRLIRLVQLLIAMWITALTALYLLLQASISTSHFFFFPVALHSFPKTLNTKIIVFLVSCTEKSTEKKQYYDKIYVQYQEFCQR